MNKITYLLIVFLLSLQHTHAQVPQATIIVGEDLSPTIVAPSSIKTIIKIV